MSLGAGALKVSRGPSNKQRGGMHGNPGSGNHPKSSHDSQVGKNWSATISKQSYNAKQH